MANGMGRMALWAFVIIVSMTSPKSDVAKVSTQFNQNLIAKLWSIDRKSRFSFSYRMVRRLMSFILQKNSSTRFRIAQMFGSRGNGSR